MDVLDMNVKETLKRREGKPAMEILDFLDLIPETVLSNYMYKNQGDLTYTNVGEEWGFTHPTLCRITNYQQFPPQRKTIPVSSANRGAHRDDPTAGYTCLLPGPT